MLYGTIDDATQQLCPVKSVNALAMLLYNRMLKQKSFQETGSQSSRA